MARYTLYVSIPKMVRLKVVMTWFKKFFMLVSIPKMVRLKEDTTSISM